MELVVDLKQETSVHKAWVRTYVEIGEEILDVRSISVLFARITKGEVETISNVASLNSVANPLRCSTRLFPQLHKSWIISKGNFIII